jgi:hypothetical protein
MSEFLDVSKEAATAAQTDRERRARTVLGKVEVVFVYFVFAAFTIF